VWVVLLLVKFYMSKYAQEKIHQNQVDRVLKEGIYSDLLNNRVSIAEGQDCPLCLKRENGQPIGTMRVMKGQYGKFLSCNRYPECRFSWNTPDLVEDMKNQNPLEKVIV